MAGAWVGIPGNGGHGEIDPRHKVFADLAGSRAVKGVLVEGEVVGGPLVTHLNLLVADLGESGGAGFHQGGHRIKAHQGVGTAAGCGVEVYGDIVTEQLEAVGVDHPDGVGGGLGRIGGVGVDQASATNIRVVATILVVKNVACG